MNTPICDFVRRYTKQESLRLHMPGHKGNNFIGIENFDITEIEAADSLYEADGIIRQSELNASKLFGANTFYSTEGSSHCIRAMLYLTVAYAKSLEKRPLIAAARNVHKTFLSAAAMLDFNIMWLYPEQESSYLSCKLNAESIDKTFSQAKEKPVALYITSPDYLGGVTDIKSISKVCRKHGVLLVVDNAHGAYLKFLQPSLHPIDLGADICCDSAHKTLPVLTGGAYLHISKNAPDMFLKKAKDALALFGSTSPSYLILQSLDAANAYIANAYENKLANFVSKVQQLKEKLINHGYCLQGDEPLKITVKTKPYGYTGTQFAKILLEKNIVCEFSDPDFVVMMLTPEIKNIGLSKIEEAFVSVIKKPEIKVLPPKFKSFQTVMSVREATFSLSETVLAENSQGRILAATSIGCPPAVPIIVCGERIDKNTVDLFSYYKINNCLVVIEDN